MNKILKYKIKQRSKWLKANSHKQKAFLLLFILTILFSCEKKVTWNLNNSQKQFIIVDGIITNEHKNQTIKLSLSKVNINDVSKVASNAEISIYDGISTFMFHEDISNLGTYISNTQFSGVINKTYYLNIEYKNEEYSAETSMLPIAISSPLPYKQIQDTNMYYIAADIASFNPSQASMYEVILDWSEVAAYESFPTSETSAHMFFYNLTTIDVNQIFSPLHETVYFPHGTKMTQKKYSLNSEHEEFIRSLLSENQWHGGYFDIEEGNVYTNISNGAFGFFGACSVISYSTLIE